MAERALCEDCDHGIRGGIPCASCGGTGLLLTPIEAAFCRRAQEAEAQIVHQADVIAANQVAFDALQSVCEQRLRAKDAALLDWENREAAWCPEDVGFEEHIRDLQQQHDVLKPGGSFAWKHRAEVAEAALVERTALIERLREWLDHAIERSAQQAKEAIEKDDQEKGMAALGALGALQLVLARLRETPAPPQEPTKDHPPLRTWAEIEAEDLTFCAPAPPKETT
jgi:hypothetical protein